jgi:DNA-binding NarL/FixJ family response regulator
VVRILIADDHEVVRAGLVKVLEAKPAWEIVAAVEDGRAAVRMARETQPDIAIVDYSLPSMNGIEVARAIREGSPKTEILIFTMYDNETIIREAMAAGANGYLLKSDAGKHLVEAIETLAGHRRFFSGRVSEALVGSFARTGISPPSPLTARERQVVRLIAEGRGNKDIARLLGISLKTVETHRASVMRKLELGSAAALVRYAIRNNLIEP